MTATPPPGMTLEEFLNSFHPENFTGTVPSQSMFSIPLGPNFPGTIDGINPNLNISFTLIDPATLPNVIPTGLSPPSTASGAATVLGAGALVPTNNSSNPNPILALTQEGLSGNPANTTTGGNPSNNTSNNMNTNPNAPPSAFSSNFPGFPSGDALPNNDSTSENLNSSAPPAVFAPNIPGIPGTIGNNAPNPNTTGLPPGLSATFPPAAWSNLGSLIPLPSFTTNNPASLLDFFNNLTASLGGIPPPGITTISVEPGTSPEMGSKIRKFEQEMQQLRFSQRRQNQTVAKACTKGLAEFEQSSSDTDDFQESIIVEHLKSQGEIQLENADEGEREAAEAKALAQDQHVGISLINALLDGVSDDEDDVEEVGGELGPAVTAPFAGVVTGSSAAWEAADMIVDQADFWEEDGQENDVEDLEAADEADD